MRCTVRVCEKDAHVNGILIYYIEFESASPIYATKTQQFFLLRRSWFHVFDTQRWSQSTSDGCQSYILLLIILLRRNENSAGSVTQNVVNNTVSRVRGSEWIDDTYRNSRESVFTAVESFPSHLEENVGRLVSIWLCHSSTCIRIARTRNIDIHFSQLFPRDLFPCRINFHWNST